MHLDYFDGNDCGRFFTRQFKISPYLTFHILSCVMAKRCLSHIFPDKDVIKAVLDKDYNRHVYLYCVYKSYMVG